MRAPMTIAKRVWLKFWGENQTTKIDIIAEANTLLIRNFQSISNLSSLKEKYQVKKKANEYETRVSIAALKIPK